jgi:hypothetical protein
VSDLVVRTCPHNGVEVVEAPQETRISLEMFHQAGIGPHLRVWCGRINLANQVTYEVTGWDAEAFALVVRLVEDRR